MKPYTELFFLLKKNVLVCWSCILLWRHRQHLHFLFDHSCFLEQHQPQTTGETAPIFSTRPLAQQHTSSWTEQMTSVMFLTRLRARWYTYGAVISMEHLGKTLPGLQSSMRSTNFWAKLHSWYSSNLE